MYSTEPFDAIFVLQKTTRERNAALMGPSVELHFFQHSDVFSFFDAIMKTIDERE